MVRLVLCNCPPSVGETLARRLVESRIAACVNVSAPVRSVYHWKGAVETDEEVTLLIKLPDENLQALHEFIAKEHPYELPEVLTISIDEAASSQAYLRWVREVTGT